MVLSLGLPAAIDLAKKNGVAVLAIKNSTSHGSPLA
jgi:LDH2 family malate/lactate/ureidoglycolate dehydrogenase